MAQKKNSWKQAWLHFYRALLLRCPLCGRSPLFVPFKKTHSLYNWLMPLDGCPRCGYAYERESGYFLLAIWAINYGFGSILGLIIYFFLEWRYPNLNIWKILGLVLSPIVFVNIFFARHAKAFFLAFDLLLDPPQREKGNDDGGGHHDKPEKPIPPASPSHQKNIDSSTPSNTVPMHELVGK
ncbi:MAG: hypothetical protein K2W99_04150 [Chthoniobacterales bacterium]|nr:hypothetical protein [Chthoniobacterales bacterium]